MRPMLKTTTAMIASLAMVMPAPIIAQEQANITCQDGAQPPCPEGDPANALIAEQEAAAAAALAAALADAEAQAAAEAAVAAEAEAAAQAQAAAEAQAAADAAVAADAAAAEQAAAEAQAAAQAAIDAQAAAEAQAAADAQAATEAAAAEAATEAQIAAEAQAAADAQAAEAQAAADAEAAVAVEAAAEAAAQEAAAEAEAQAAAAAAAQAATEAATSEAIEEPAADAAETAPEPEVAATEEELAKKLLGAEPTVAAEEAASGEAPEAAAIEAAMEPEAEQEAASADVVEEVVTEESARTSFQDFETSVAGVVRPEAKKKKSGGLSDFEKILLVGAGAMVVGAIISNNRKVELNSGDRVVVSRDDGSYEILKDDNALLRQPGSTVRTRTFDDGSTLTTITRADGTKIVTIRDANGRVLRRTHVDLDGYQTVLIDDTYEYEPVVIRDLPRTRVERDYSSDADEAALRKALLRDAGYDQTFSLAQIRNIAEVRNLVPLIDLESITFDSGSAAIKPDQARSLARVGKLIADMIAENPREVFLIEGHTDAIGRASYNLALSDRRAESVALALTEYFGVPPENLVIQGYGEEFLKIDTQADERRNRRAGVRRVTTLLRTASN